VVLPLHMLVLGHLRATAAQSVMLGIPTYLYFLVVPLRSGSRRGQTVGKQARGIRIVRADGAAVGIREMLPRELVSTATGVASLLPFGLGLLGLADPIWILVDRDRRALHDLVARTRVIDARQARHPSVKADVAAR
jgi:uncharacterized RDD family membrane protein YckC